MDWEAIGAIGELLGAIVVIVSVLYLAAQIRQNTEQARMTSIQAINASNDSAFDPIYIPENSAIFSKGQASYGDLDEHETLIFDMLMSRLIACIDTTSYQYREGMIDKEMYDRYVLFYSKFVSTPGGIEWLHRYQFSVSPETLAELKRSAKQHSA
jgi:hypothetical protein